MVSRTRPNVTLHVIVSPVKFLGQFATFVEHLTMARVICVGHENDLLLVAFWTYKLLVALLSPHSDTLSVLSLTRYNASSFVSGLPTFCIQSCTYIEN